MDKILVDLVKLANERRGKGALQELSEVFGFNYNKPIKVARFDGAFTPTSLKKDYGIDVKSERVAVIFSKKNYNAFRLAEYTDGKFEVFCRCFSVFSSVTSKREANEWRVWEGCREVFVISQAREYLLPRVDRNWQGRANLDINTRYKAVRPDEPFYGVVEFDRKPSTKNNFDVDFDEETFDKSGYPVALKREGFTAKIRAMKEAKSVEAYKAMTNRQDMIAKVRKAIEAKKIELSTRLLDCNTADMITELGYDLTSYNGLCGCYYNLKRIEEKDKNEGFKSPEEFNSAISLIYGYLALI